ncbi:MAG TPA: DinB family protein [Candidatus Acidoferrales bacterium]|nr:DinB family protein [Candidatus Acidoferrales bacterium]
MALNQSLLPEFDHEMANTRKTLERVPDGKFSWQPHQKSMTLGRLASHLADIPSWVAITLNENSVDVNPPGGAQQRPQAGSRQELLAQFDKNVAAARSALAGATDEQFTQTWSLLNGGKTVFTLPKVAVYRGFIMSHSIHHRAQLGVYLRLNDVPVPSIYGPSADEQTF